MKKLLALPFLILAAPVLADHPSIAFGNEASGPIVTIAPSFMPANAWGFGMRREVIHNDSFSDQQLINYAERGIEGVHSLDKIITTSLSAAYGVSDTFTFSARLPYIERRNIRAGEVEDGEVETHRHGNSAGMGDLLMMGHYRLLDIGTAKTGILFGIKAPTGKTDDKDDHGQRFETEFQPGSGSWDFLLGASAGHSFARLNYYANVLYYKTTEGSQSTEIGDALNYNLAMSYRINPEQGASHHHHPGTEDHVDFQWDAILEVNGETRRKNKIAGHSEDNSGGTTVYLSPGIRMTAGKLGGFVSVGLPIIENQNGKQTDINSRIMAGVSLAFD